MKNLSSIIFFFLISSTAFSQGMSYQCEPSGDSSLDAGVTDGTISKITKLSIPKATSPEMFKVVLDVEGRSYGDNQDTSSQLSYAMKEMKDGTMFELSENQQNAFSFNAIFLQFGNIDVITAGPIPMGTYKAALSMAFIDSNIFYQNKYPMKVAKVDFDCLVTVEY